MHGFSNRETWEVSTLINDSESGYHMACAIVKNGSRLEAEYDLEELIKGVHGHMDIDFNAVNWTEITDMLKSVGGFK